MCSTAEFPTNKPPYIGILLVEPAIVSKELYTDNIDAHDFATDMAIKATNARRDTWDSRDNAFQWLSKSPPWKFWDPRALRLYAVRFPRNSTDASTCIDLHFAGSWPSHNTDPGRKRGDTQVPEVSRSSQLSSCRAPYRSCKIIFYCLQKYSYSYYLGLKKRFQVRHIFLN